jgi:uncharacterized protein (TIGR03435 family)
MVESTLGLSVVKVTLAAALGLLAVRLAARCAAAVRHAVLVTTFVALAAIPIVAAVAPPYFVRIEYGTWPISAALMETGLAHLKIATFSPSSQQQSDPRWPTLLFAAWASGAALCLLPQLGALLQSRRLRRGGRPWAAALAEAPRFRGRRHSPVHLLHHPDVSGPMTCGIVRPIILLPEDARRWPRQDLDRALAHELAHIARADVLVHALARCVCADYWFHPLVWVCWRRLRQEAERACDDAVVAIYEPAAYAQQLLALARRQQARLSASMTAMADRGELAVRIHAILDSSQPRQRLGRRGAMAIAIILIACVSGVAPLTPVRAAPRSHALSDLTFSSASVLRSRAHQPLSMQSLPDGRVRIAGASLRRLLRLAYGFQDHAIVSAPAWMNSDRFDITATAAPGSTPGAVLQMLRTLLAQRFALRTEHDVQRRPVFTLTRRRTSGTELRPSRGCESNPQTSLPRPPAGSVAARRPCGFRVGHGRLEGVGIDLDALAATLSTPLGRAVVVEGPAFGEFDFVLTWNTAAADPVATLTEALDRQLGLTIVSQQRDVPVLVIRSARPLV